MQITITQWKDEYAESFKALSLEWLEKYVEVEPRDIETFEHPYEVVLHDGGMIWFALADGKPVGTVGILREKSGEWELVKLAVTEAYQGRGIGRLLIETVLQYAKKIGLSKITLFTNSKLKPAIHLYQQVGFQNIALSGESYKTSDVKMELILTQ